jgi:hypothetical protein
MKPTDGGTYCRAKMSTNEVQSEDMKGKQKECPTHTQETSAVGRGPSY